MKTLFMTLLMMLISSAAIAQDQITVNVNGKTYACSGGGNSSQQPYVSSVYCECLNTAGVYLRRIAI